MGTWGYGIFEDDFTLDVKDLFNSFIKEEVGIDQIIARLVRFYSEEIQDVEDGPLFFFALSSLLLERNELREDIKEQTINVINLGIDQEKWKRAGFFSRQARKRALNNLKKSLDNTNFVNEVSAVDQEDLENDRFKPGTARYSVYELSDQKTEKVYYVGKTINLELRSKYFELNPMKN
ncbi:hypothetical protein Back11_56560 [Paenibacillus baekrokdamisoli]|uniref:Uncharacterized protein n=1 Tax=Paenibacillus baekrokdamisoli TaxID=1712516 RepID=A0A3G9JEH8_9BACL|nr:hypothetical protein [Paenibacillus baekrokdamisoli]MBB3073182.1 hypothetical protein [Paenibacillus baekrokdamisoli]BBH24311.1 hypothetical protein Back11_56560 [Paenibacillus baekrokdamisoli]